MKKNLLLLFALLLGAISSSATEVVLSSKSYILKDWSSATEVIKATSSQVAVGDFLKIVVDDAPAGSSLLFKKADYSDACVGNGQLHTPTYYQVTSDIYDALTGDGIIFQGNGSVQISTISIIPASDFDVVTVYNEGGIISSTWGSVPVPGANFNAARAGDILVVNTTATAEVATEANFLFKKNGYEDALSTYNLTMPWCVPLTNEVISGYYVNNNHIQAAKAGITVNSVQILRLKENLPKGSISLTPDEALPTAFGNWAKSVKVSADQFANIQVGDEIRISLTDADKATSYNAQMFVKYQGEGYPLLKPIGEDGGYFVPYTPEIVFTISDATIVNNLKNYGLVLQGQNVTVSSVKLYCSEVTATIDPSYEWATFSSDYALDFSGVSDLKAYMVLGHEGTTITKTQVTGTVPAGTGLLLNGVTANIPVVASSSTDVSANKLKRGTGAGVATESGKTKYVLSHDGTAVKFLKVSEYDSPTVDKGKAYLEFNEVISARSLDFDGDVTAIKNIKVGSEDNVYYDLQGRRVLYPTKGLYIVNGKKVILK